MNVWKNILWTTSSVFKIGKSYSPPVDDNDAIAKWYIDNNIVWKVFKYVTLWETIEAWDKKWAVYEDETDWKVYKSDTSVSAKNKCDWIIIESWVINDIRPMMFSWYLPQISIQSWKNIYLKNWTSFSFLQDELLSILSVPTMDISFADNWNSVFILGRINKILYKYDLSTPYDLWTATYSQQYDCSIRDTNARWFKIVDWWTRIFLLWNDSESVYRFTLSTPYDLSTISYNQSLTLNFWMTDPIWIDLKPDGTKLFITSHASPNVIHEFTMSTPYDLSTRTYIWSFDLSANIDNVRWVRFNDDWTKAFFTWIQNDRIYEYSLSTAYTISTLSFVDSHYVWTQDWVPFWLDFNSDWTEIYIAWYINKKIFKYDMTTWYDLTWISYDQSYSFSLSSLANPNWLRFNSTWTKMFVLDVASKKVTEYDLSVAYDTSTLSYSQDFTVAAGWTGLDWLEFSSDWTKMYVIRDTENNIYQYNLSTWYNLSTASFSQTFSYWTRDNSMKWLTFNWDWTKMFLVWAQNNKIYQYSLSVGYDISTASYVQDIIADEDSFVTWICFNSSWTKLYLSWWDTDSIKEYELSTEYDVSSLQFIQSIDISSQVIVPQSVAINSAWDKIYVTSYAKKVFEYSLDENWEKGMFSSSMPFTDKPFVIWKSNGSNEINLLIQEQKFKGNNSPSSITVGGSPFSYKNETQNDMRIHIEWWTVSSIDITILWTNYDTWRTSWVFIIRSWESIKVTYSSAPTMNVLY